MKKIFKIEIFKGKVFPLNLTKIQIMKIKKRINRMLKALINRLVRQKLMENLRI